MADGVDRVIVAVGPHGLVVVGIGRGTNFRGPRLVSHRDSVIGVGKCSLRAAVEISRRGIA